MAVGLRGAAGGRAVAGTTVAWPAGTVSGDLALLHCGGALEGTGPQTSGWVPVGHKAWMKALTSADVASSLVLTATHYKLAVFTGAGGIGRTSSQNGVTVAGAGSGVWWDGSRGSSSIAPSTYQVAPGEWTGWDGWWEAAYFRAIGAGWTTLPGAASGSTWYTYEVTPTSAPAGATVTSPGPGARVDQTAALAVSWEHNSPLPQSGYRVRLTNGATIRYLDAAGALQTTVQSVTSAASTAAVNAAALTAGGSYTVAVATSNSLAYGAYGAEVPFFPDAPPSALSVSVTAPAGDLTPEVTGAATAGYGSIVAFRYVIAPAASPDPIAAARWDSGIIPGTPVPRSAPSSRPWVNGESLKAWLYVWQTGGVSASAASSAFAVSWTPPFAPSISWIPPSDAEPPVVRVSLLAAGDLVEVYMQRTDGTWMRLAAITATDETLEVAAPLAMRGTTVWMRARRGTVVDGVPMWSDWSNQSGIERHPSTGWLVDDTDRTVAIRAPMRRDTDRGIVQGVSVTYGLGAVAARVDRTPEAGEYGSLVLVAEDETDRAALLAWLRDRPVFWLVFPPDASGASPLPQKRVSRVTAPSWERITSSSALGTRDLPLSWVEQPE